MRAHRCLLGLLLALLGCGGNGGGGTAAPTELTEAQRAQTGEAVDLLMALAEAAASFAPVAELDLSSFDADSGTVGTCPRIAGDRGGGVLTLDVDYGTGCSSPNAGNEVRVGSVQLILDLLARSAVASFVDLQLGDEAVTGTLGGQLNGSPLDPDSIGATANLTFADRGTIAGTATVGFGVNGAVLLPAGNLALTEPGGATYAVTLANVVIDPAGNGNFVPESGTATIAIPNEGLGPATINVGLTFTAQTPLTGTVLLSVNGSPAIPATIPGLVP